MVHSSAIVPKRKHRQEQEDSVRKAALRPLTAQDIAEIRQAQQANQERIDALGIQPIVKAYNDCSNARVEFTCSAIGFYVVLAVLWFVAQAEQPVGIAFSLGDKLILKQKA